MTELASIMTIVITGITSGSIVGSIVAFKKDRRDTLQADLDYTDEFRRIAKEVVKETRAELTKTIDKVKKLEDRIIYLEKSVKSKDRIITILVDYIGRLRDILNLIDPKHPLPLVPEEVKDYIK